MKKTVKQERFDIQGIALSNQMSCMVAGEAVSGDMKIDDKFSTGELTLTVKSSKGNVTVK